MKLLILLSIMITSQALANGGKNEPNSNNSSVSNASAGSVSGSTSNSVSANKNVNNLSNQSLSATNVGDTTATGGNSSAASGDSEANVSVNTRHRRAPVNTAFASTGMNTADMLVCFSLAGQTRGAGASGIKCWLQRDLYANYRAQLHAEAGRFEASARAACSKPLFSGDFDSIEDCRASVYQSLIDQQVDGQVIEASYNEHILLKQCDEEKGELLDRVTKECGTVRK